MRRRSSAPDEPSTPDPRRRLERVVDEATQRPGKVPEPVEHPRADALVHQRHREDVGRSERQRTRHIGRVPEEEQRVPLGEREGELVMARDVAERKQMQPDVALGARGGDAPGLDGMDDGPLRQTAHPSGDRWCRW